MRRTRLRLSWASAIASAVIGITVALAVWALDNPTGNCSGVGAAHTCTDASTATVTDPA